MLTNTHYYVINMLQTPMITFYNFQQKTIDKPYSRFVYTEIFKSQVKSIKSYPHLNKPL